MSNEFWLYEWLDEYDVKSIKTASRLLKLGDPSVGRLQELAVASSDRNQLTSTEGTAILAGRGIDLSGDWDCCRLVSQRQYVDALFSRVWHYFDEIVIVGPSGESFAHSLERLDEETTQSLLNYVDAFLYMRQVGAEDMVSFVEKTRPCTQHYAQHAREAGLGEVLERGEDWIEGLAEHGTVRHVRRHGAHWHYTFAHPELEHDVNGEIWGERESEARDPDLHEVAEAVFARYVSHLVSDVETARLIEVPLGAGLPAHEGLLTQRAHVTESDVAFNLRLPTLNNLPLSELLKIRQDEWVYFDHFRQSLKEAIRQRVSSDAASPAVVAEQIYEDVIEPGLNDVTRRLDVIQKALDRKLATGIAIGGLITTVGVITGAPLIIGAGIAAMGSSVPVAQKYFDDKGSIELADMYFLWRLEERANRHAKF